MKNILFLLLVFCAGFLNFAFAQTPADKTLPVCGFCIAAPQTDEAEAFVKFIAEELALRKVNTLIPRVDYNYQYESHPELRNEKALSKAEVKNIVDVCRKNQKYCNFTATGILVLILLKIR